MLAYQNLSFCGKNVQMETLILKLCFEKNYVMKELKKEMFNPNNPVEKEAGGSVKKLNLL